MISQAYASGIGLTLSSGWAPVRGCSREVQHQIRYQDGNTQLRKDQIFVGS